MELIDLLWQAVLQFIDVILHLDTHLLLWAGWMGPWIYAVLFAIIFAETGLVVFPFLPGDSLLFALGALCAASGANAEDNVLVYHWVAITILSAAFLGDITNYSVGKHIGVKAFNSRFLNQKHLKRTEEFYAKHGGKTVIMARFVPIVRTFAPFVAGVGTMTFRRFITFSVAGTVLWVLTFLTAGYVFGNIPAVKGNFHFVIFGIIGVSVLPMLLEYLKARRASAAVSVLPLLLGFGLAVLPAHAEEITGAGAHSEADAAAESDWKAHLEVGLYGSVFGAYKQGNLGNWFRAVAQSPEASLRPGSAPAYQLEVMILNSPPSDRTRVGGGFGLYKNIATGIQGTHDGTELTLEPTVLSAFIPLQIGLGPVRRSGKRSAFFTLEGGLLIGWVTGQLQAGEFQRTRFLASPGMGLSLATGFQYFFTGNLGLSLKAGYRALKTDLTYSDELSPTGFSKPQVNGETVSANLGGFYGLAGIVAHL